MIIGAPLTNGYMRTLGRQLRVMANFAHAPDLQSLQGVWPATQAVLEDNDIGPHEIVDVPVYDADLPAFQRLVLASTRPRLSSAVLMLFGDPVQLTVSVLQELSAEDTNSIATSHAVSEGASHMLMASAELYAKLGKQIQTAAAYFLSKEDASDELMWGMKMLFVIHNLSSAVLRSNASALRQSSYSGAVRNMVKPKLEAQLVTLLNEGAGKDILFDKHGVSAEILTNGQRAGVIASDHVARAKRIVGGFRWGFFGKLFGRS